RVHPPARPGARWHPGAHRGVLRDPAAYLQTTIRRGHQGPIRRFQVHPEQRETVMTAQRVLEFLACLVSLLLVVWMVADAWRVVAAARRHGGISELLDEERDLLNEAPPSQDAARKSAVQEAR